MNRRIGNREDARRDAAPNGHLPFPFGFLPRRIVGDLLGIVFALLLPVSQPRRLLALGIIRVASAIARRLLQRSGSPTAQFLDRLLASSQRLR
jgi:hypothetical protein